MLCIHRMELADIPVAAVLEAKIFSDAWSAPAMADSYHRQNTLLLGAYEEQELIGYLILYYVLDEGEIVRLAVDENHRRAGVAGHLLLELANFCEDRGIVNLFLEVREHNDAAISFYQENGFREEGIRKNFYTNPTEDGILMSRELGR